MRSVPLKKAAIIVLLLAVASAFYFFHAGRYLSLDYVKESQARFDLLYRSHPAKVILGYAVLYIMITSLSLPGAAALTLAGGALFGLLTGTIIVSFSSTIGATTACAVSRFLLRDWVQKRFGERIGRLNEGIEREGAFYLFTLRLIPVFPFWLINLAMGLTRMRLATFYWVSQVGMLAGTVVYVNAGKELAKIDSLGGIVSPGLLGSFALLGVFPLVAKKAVAWYRLRRGAG